VELDTDREARLNGPIWHEAIVMRTEDRIYTRQHVTIDGVEQWTDYATVYYIADPPTYGLPLAKIGLPEGVPSEWEDVQPRNQETSLEAYHAAVEYMGDAGIVGICEGLPGLGLQPESMYEYYDDQPTVIARCEQTHEWIVRHTKEVLKMKPDFILIGISGFMISNPEPIFRKLALPTLKEVTALCKQTGVPSQIHCCGPEYSLVKIAAEESDLSNINPLEIPPMGDCNLAQVKREFGGKVSLMGNLHTTEVMLRGTPEKVAEESRKAIDAAGPGGGFILSTGDQCGRDTPFENIRAMVETARTYGRY
jgi:uroporphyrinogen decarboxylase